MLLPEVERMDLQRHLADFAAHGFAQLGPVLAEAAAVELADCAEAMMSGDAAHPGVFYQHDSPTGQYEDLRFNAGWGSRLQQDGRARPCAIVDLGHHIERGK